MASSLESRLPLFRIFWDQEDIEAVEKTLKRGSFWAEGPEIRQFEKALEQYTGSRHVLAFNSGTSALHAALLALGVEGKEVIVPSFTFVSSVNAVVLAGAKPVFAEVEPETFALDAEDAEKRLTGKTAAILPTHYAGMPARDIESLKELAGEKGIVLVEDAAESMGAKINGKLAGTFGEAGMFSFCQNKVVAAGEGGAVATDDEKLAEKLRLLRSHGRNSQDYFSSAEQEDYPEIGFNYRMPSIMAALGRSQLQRIEKMIELRRNAAAYYSKALSGIEGITIPAELDGSRNVFQMYSVLVGNGKRDALQKHLAEDGIMSKVYFGPVHLKTVYREKFGGKPGMLPFTEELSEKVLSLPFWPGIEEKEMNSVLDSIKRFFGES